MAESDHIPRVVVIGCGNALRGDDAVGLIIARALRPRLPAAVRVIEHRDDGLALLDAWRGAQLVLLVDAAVGGGVPGEVARFDAAARALPVTLRASSTHVFGAGEAIELARALGELPPFFIVYAISGTCYVRGRRLSPEVRAAGRYVLHAIARDVQSVSRAAVELGARGEGTRPRNGGAGDVADT